MAVIEVRNLTKRYGQRTVVDDISFDMEEGAIFGFLGLNGAGKTTTLESIAGPGTPDSGTIRVLGLDPRRDNVKLKQHSWVFSFRLASCRSKSVYGKHSTCAATFYKHPADGNSLSINIAYRQS